MSSLSVSSSGIACPVAMISLAGVAVVLRILVRLKRLAIEDVLVVVSLIFSGLSVGFLIKQSTVSLEPQPGLQLFESDFVSILEVFGKAGYLSSLFYYLSFGFVQIAFLLSFLRWLSVSAAADVEGRAPLPRPRSRLVKAILGFITIYNIWLFGMQMVKCIPLQARWNLLVQASFCLPQEVWWAANFVHILINFVVLLLGIAVAVRTWIREILAIRKKRTTTTTTRTSQKTGLAIVFVLGFLVCIISILRVIRSPSEPSNFFQPSSNNFTFNAESDMFSTWERTDILTIFELNVAIVCACLCTLKPVWSAFTKRLLRWCGRAASRDGVGESDGGSMTKFGELDGVARRELDSGHGHRELEAVGQHQEPDGVARQQCGELDGTVVAELDGGQAYTTHGQELMIGEKHEADNLPTR